MALNKTWREKLKEKFWGPYRFLARLRMLLSRDRIFETPEGERYFVNRYSYVERAIAEGMFEKKRAAYLRALLGPEDVFLDIGANIGLFTILAAKRGASVQSFEPDPVNQQRLMRNIKLNGFSESQVVVHPDALGNENGEVMLYRPLNNNYGMASTVVRFAPDGIPVPLRRLDDVLTVSSRRHVVKVDVEGAELQVLDGARASLQQMKEGSLWLVEVHVTESIEVEAVAERFRQLGYDISYFDDGTGEIMDHPQLSADPLLLARRRLTA